MARTLQITTPPDQTAALLDTIQATDGVVGVRLQRGGSVVPPGDVVTVDVTNRGGHVLLRVLSAGGLAPGASLSTAEPFSLVVPGAQAAIAGDTNDASWEEMDATIRSSTNMRPNAVVLMAASGVLAAVGLATDALELVIAAMVIAPEFQPLIQVALGTVSGSRRAARAGLGHVAVGWAALALSAAATAGVVQASGQDPLGGGSAYLSAGALRDYFTTVSVPSTLVDVAAATAGAVLIASRRSYLTAGVSIALPLVPLTALVGVALVAGETHTALVALSRWGLDAILVLLAGLAVFGWKRVSVQKRSMMP